MESVIHTHIWQFYFFSDLDLFCFFSLIPVTCACVMNCFSHIRLFSRVRLFATPWTAAHQASLSITNSQSLLKFMSITSVMPSNHLILCRPLLYIHIIYTCNSKLYLLIWNFCAKGHIHFFKYCQNAFRKRWSNFNSN